MKVASLATGITSISISVIFWVGIIFSNLAQVGGDESTAIALVLTWLFIGCPVILILSVVSLIKAFTKPNPSQGASQGIAVQSMKSAKIVSLISVACFVAPFLYGMVITPIING